MLRYHIHSYFLIDLDKSRQFSLGKSSSGKMTVCFTFRCWCFLFEDLFRLPESIWNCKTEKNENFETKINRILLKRFENKELWNSEFEIWNNNLWFSNSQDGKNESPTKPESIHFSELDVKTMKIQELREQLDARSLSSKGKLNRNGHIHMPNSPIQC